MSFITSFDQSNTADWIIDVSATDNDTGAAVDFSAATIMFVVKDENGSQVLSASTTDGKITLPSSTVVMISFTASQLSALCPGSYKVGCVYKIGTTITQLFVGTVAVYDGVAQL
jgi:hypothetical protein